MHVCCFPLTILCVSSLIIFTRAHSSLFSLIKCFPNSISPNLLNYHWLQKLITRSLSWILPLIFFSFFFTEKRKISRIVESRPLNSNKRVLYCVWLCKFKTHPRNSNLAFKSSENCVEYWSLNDLFLYSQIHFHFENIFTFNHFCFIVFFFCFLMVRLLVFLFEREILFWD